jgi:tripartite-type tricarboxylate transporter receptor subunit TctC
MTAACIRSSLHRDTIMIASPRLLVIFASLCFITTSATAQEFPTRPITLVVPFPPGGSTTIVGRIIAEKMGDVLGQPVVVDNRGGAAGTLGARQVAASAPDGYTILLGYSGTLSVAPSFYQNVGYDVRKDFTPIGRIGAAPSTLTVHPSFPAKTVAEFVGYAKENPGRVNYGSAGVGSLNHIAGEYLAVKTGIKITHVPYKGSGPVLNDLLGGHIPAAFAPVPTVQSNVQAGMLRMLAVTGLKRSNLLPDIPTVAETVPGYEAVLRYGLLAPAGTPRPVIEKLNAALKIALATEDVKQKLAIEGADPAASTPEEYAADIDREESQWSGLIKSLGIKAQ